MVKMSLQQKLADEVRTRGAQPVAKELRMNKTTVLSFVAGTANEGTQLLVEKRDAERRAATSK